MNIKTLATTSLTCLLAVSPFCVAEQPFIQPKISIQGGAWVMDHNVHDNSQSDAAETDDHKSFKGTTVSLAASFNDNVQARFGIYKANNNANKIKAVGRFLHLNFGQGFKEQGVVAFATIGYFGERFGETKIQQSYNGIELGGSAGYNFGFMSVIGSLAIRSGQDYAEYYEDHYDYDNSVGATTYQVSASYAF